MDDSLDIVVVGGGAAGFYGAITCANAAPDSTRVLILERGRRVLQKVRISGGGRCNVTHDCLEPKRMARNYPRGNQALIGPLYHHGVRQTLQWFESRGLEWKVEEDGRIFPVSDDSQSVINCLRGAADEAGVELRTSSPVTTIRRVDSGDFPFEIELRDGEVLGTRQVLLATGGTRIASSASLPEMLGHTLASAVPSLFTFRIDDQRIEDLQGLVVEPVEVTVEGQDLSANGPLLITHWGMSGPAVLKCSAWGARILHGVDYRFTLHVDWLPGVDVVASFDRLRSDWGARQVATRSPFEAIPRRLWRRLVEAAGVPTDRRWAEFSSRESQALFEQLRSASFAVTGQSTYKDEFVTCGGVPTDQVDMRTMESRIVDGLYFAGELLDIDGVTGGYNFQNAWTTGFLAGEAMAERLR